MFTPPHLSTIPMLYLVKGPRGSGKTAWVVRELLLIKRRPVVTNIQIGHWDKIKVLRLSDRKVITERVFVLAPPNNCYYVPSHEMTVDKLISMAREFRKKYGKRDIVLAVDEGGLKWDSRHKAAGAARNFWLRFYRVSRHFGYDEVYVITQVETSVDAQIRGLADVIYEMLNLKAAFPFLCGWFPYPFGVLRRKFQGMELKPLFRWPFYVILPWTLNRYDTRQGRDEFQQELEEFRRLLARQTAAEANKERKELAEAAAHA